MAKAKNAYDGGQSLAELAAAIDGQHEENKDKLSVREKADRDRKNKAFTVKWRRMDYDETMKAFYSEVSRLAGTMERWKREELQTRRHQAVMDYTGYANAPFDLVDEAVALRKQIHRLRYRANTELPDQAYEVRTLEGDEEKAKKLEAEATRLIEEKMPAVAFKIYRNFCKVAHVIQTDTDQRMVVKLSDYEVYDYDYEEEL